MSLRTKMMLSIFAFMILVLGLLTLNLWLDAAGRARAEARRNADLVARMVTDWFRETAPASGTWKDEDWARLSRRMSESMLISGWTVVAADDRGALKTVLSSHADPGRILREDGDLLRTALSELRVDAVGARAYLPLPSEKEQRLAARVDLEGSAAPAYDIADAMKGILTVMALGTALLLLNAYVFTNRLVLRPLGTLVEASNRVAAGDFSKKIPEGAAYDEMGRMVRAFNLMIDKIAGSHGALREDIRQARGRIHETERRLFAAQRLSTTGTLAAGIAHEINNPLGGMINAAQSLRDGRLDAAKRAEYVELIRDGLERIRAIVQKILHFRPRPFRPQPVRLREAVEQAVAFLQHRTRARGVAVHDELPADLPLVNGDPLELQQAFLNVVMNAVDACAEGAGVIRIRHALAGDSVSVSVIDNGCGMDGEQVARCMDLFYTTKDVGEGTGLGLSVAHNIVANHGGRIDVESRPGEGATFTLTFPVMKPRAMSARSEVSG